LITEKSDKPQSEVISLFIFGVRFNRDRKFKKALTLIPDFGVDLNQILDPKSRKNQGILKNDLVLMLDPEKIKVCIQIKTVLF